MDSKIIRINPKNAFVGLAAAAFMGIGLIGTSDAAVINRDLITENTSGSNQEVNYAYPLKESNSADYKGDSFVENFVRYLENGKKAKRSDIESIPKITELSENDSDDKASTEEKESQSLQRRDNPEYLNMSLQLNDFAASCNELLQNKTVKRIIRDNPALGNFVKAACQEFNRLQKLQNHPEKLAKRADTIQSINEDKIDNIAKNILDVKYMAIAAMVNLALVYFINCCCRAPFKTIRVWRQQGNTGTPQSIERLHLEDMKTNLNRIRNNMLKKDEVAQLLQDLLTKIQEENQNKSRNPFEGETAKKVIEGSHQVKDFDYDAFKQRQRKRGVVESDDDN